MWPSVDGLEAKERSVMEHEDLYDEDPDFDDEAFGEHESDFEDEYEGFGSEADFDELPDDYRSGLGDEHRSGSGEDF
jgi:hypothetical protein